ncbi:MAG: hypothetical protein ACRDJX_11260 [Solirubrobacteraceae bacterium]
MRNLAIMPAAVLALAAVPAPLVPVTASEAGSTISARIHEQVSGRLRAGYRGETHCAGRSSTQQEFTPSTPLDQWRCKLEIRGPRFPLPCKAEANVFATSQAHRPRVRWLEESRYCHEAPASPKR